MQQTPDTPDRSAWWFRGLILAHVIVWPLLLTLTRPNPSMDAVEMVFWGQQWQLGYTKHPPLPSWMAEAMALATGRALWAQYLLPHLAVALAFWAVWRLARQIVPARQALLAVCLLECCPFYSAQCYELNNNVGLYPCWALAVLFLYQALRTGRTRSWLAVGIWIGLGMLTKYTTVLLAATMFGFALVHPEARRCWRQLGPYLAIAVAALLFLPHAWWAAAHGFSTIRYAAATVPSGSHWTGHLLSPLMFLAGQMGMLAAMAAVLAVAVGGRWRLRGDCPDFRGHHAKRGRENGTVPFSGGETRPLRVADSQHFQRAFLAAMVLGPVACHVGIALLGNMSLRLVYGAPLWLFAGLFAVANLQIRPEPARWRNIWIAWAVAVTAWGAGSTIAALATPYLLHQPSRGIFPGRQLAAEVDEVWRSRYGRPLPVVAGNYFLAGSVAFFHPDHPCVYQSTGEEIDDTAVHDCPWLSDAEFRRRGGVIIWSLDVHPKGLPSAVLRRFRVSEVVELPPMDYLTRAKVPPARIGVAVVPPEE